MVVEGAAGVRGVAAVVEHLASERGAEVRVGGDALDQRAAERLQPVPRGCARAGSAPRVPGLRHHRTRCRMVFRTEAPCPCHSSPSTAMTEGHGRCSPWPVRSTSNPRRWSLCTWSDACETVCAPSTSTSRPSPSATAAGSTRSSAPHSSPKRSAGPCDCTIHRPCCCGFSTSSATGSCSSALRPGVHHLLARTPGPRLFRARRTAPCGRRPSFREIRDDGRPPPPRGLLPLGGQDVVGAGWAARSVRWWRGRPSWAHSAGHPRYSRS